MWVERISDRPDLILPVAEAMREWDRREIFATRWDDDPAAMANDAALMGQRFGWISGLDDCPIAAFGCFELWPGVFSMWLFATDNFQHIRFSMTKLIVRHIVPMLWEAGAHRLECRSMEGHVDAQAWLNLIGAKREGQQNGYGRGGENFLCYAWGKH